jgi:hypothetical protein
MDALMTRLRGADNGHVQSDVHFEIAILDRLREYAYGATDGGAGGPSGAEGLSAASRP